MIKIAENTQTGTIDLPLSLTMDVITHLSVDDNPAFFPYNCDQADAFKKLITKPGRKLRNKSWKAEEIAKWKSNNVKESKRYIIHGFSEDEDQDMDDDFLIYNEEVCKHYIIYIYFPQWTF